MLKFYFYENLLFSAVQRGGRLNGWMTVVRVWRRPDIGIFLASNFHSYSLPSNYEIKFNYWKPCQSVGQGVYFSKKLTGQPEDARIHFSVEAVWWMGTVRPA